MKKRRADNLSVRRFLYAAEGASRRLKLTG